MRQAKQILGSEYFRKYEQFRKAVDGWSRLGEKHYPDETRWIAHTPHRAPEAYLHQLFGPLDKFETLELERLVESEIPILLKFFFQLHNGTSLFFGNINVYGYRKSWIRNDEEISAQQPFSLPDANNAMRPTWLLKDLLVVGSSNNSTELALMGSNGEIDLFDRGSGQQTTKHYSDVFDFLLGEMEIIRSQYNDLGQRIDGTDRF
jgi:hypothetical protein